MLTSSLSNCKYIFDGPLLNDTKIGMKCVVWEAIQLDMKTEVASSVACLENMAFPQCCTSIFFCVTDLVSNVYFSYAQPNTLKSQHQILLAIFSHLLNAEMSTSNILIQETTLNEMVS
jgi:hypothetical protein